MPDEIAVTESAIPFDLTTQGSAYIGKLHSEFAVRHGHALFELAKIISRLTHLRRGLKVLQTQFRINNQDKFKRKYELEDAMLLDEDILKTEDKIAALTAHKELLEAVAAGFEDYRNAASREMSRRANERAAVD